MYGIDGRADLPERTLDHLSGYENARPVRVGNAAHSQAQHDVWGAVLDSVYLHTKSRDQMPESVWPLLVHAGRGGARELAQARPRHLGGARRRRATSRPPSSCAGSRWTAAPGWPRCARTGSRRRPGARPPTRSTPTSASTRSTSAASSPSTTTPTALDASILLMPLVRFLPADDARVRATVLAIADELTDRRARAALPRRGDRRRPRRRGGRVHDLLVLARLRAVRDRRDRPRRATCARSCSPTRARSGSTPRRSTRARAATSATSRRRSRTSR